MKTAAALITQSWKGMLEATWRALAECTRFRNSMPQTSSRPISTT